MRSLTISLFVLATGCAKSYTVPVPVDGAAGPDRVEAFSTSEAPDSEVALKRDGKWLSEERFEEDYLDRVKDDDLDRVAREKRRKAEGKTLLYGSASLVVGGGALALLGATQPRICGPGMPGCGKAVLGIGTLAIVAGVGVYTIGCVVVEGSHCPVIGHPPLERREAETFVKRYNATVDHGSPADPPNSP